MAVELRSPGHIRVVVADDGLLIQLLQRLPDPAASILAVVKDGQEAIEEARILQPDLVVLNEQMGQIRGTEVARQIRNVSPRSFVMVVRINLIN